MCYICYAYRYVENGNAPSTDRKNILQHFCICFVCFDDGNWKKIELRLKWFCCCFLIVECVKKKKKKNLVFLLFSFSYRLIRRRWFKSLLGFSFFSSSYSFTLYILIALYFLQFHIFFAFVFVLAKNTVQREMNSRDVYHKCFEYNFIFFLLFCFFCFDKRIFS